MALDLGELAVRLTAEDQLSNILEGAQQAARRTDTVTQQAATGVSQSTQRMAQGYQQLRGEAETYATAARTAHSKAEVAIDAAKIAQERLDAAQRDSTTSAEQLEAAQRGVADATANAERATRNSEQANDRMVASHGRAARAAREGGADAERAMQQAQQAMRDTARVAENAGEEAGSGFSDRFTGGLDRLSGAAEGAGGSTGGSFIAGFAPRVAQLGSKGGPIGAALAGVAVLGIAAGALLANAIADGMEQEQQSDLIQAKLGVNEETMAIIGKAAGDAYSNAWGESAAANKTDLGSLIQAGVLGGEEGSPEMQKILEQATAVTAILGEEMPAVARSASQAIKTGIAGDATEAFDLMVRGAQAGLNVSEDMLDTMDEYGTQFRNIGLDGPEAFGLMSQAVRNGARDTDTAADALKEFAIRATDGSKASAEGFDLLGMNAEEMTAKIALGGADAREGLGLVLDGLRDIEDPVARNAAAVGLFGTKAEDMGQALYNMDLDTASQQFGTLEGAIDDAMNTMQDNPATQMEKAKNSIKQGIAEMNGMLAKAFAPMISDLAKEVSAHKPEIITFFTEVGSAAIGLTAGLMSFGADTLRIMAGVGDAAAMALGGMISGMGDIVGIAGRVASALGADGLGDTLSGLSDGMRNWQSNTQDANDTMRTMADGMDAGASSLSGMRDGLIQTGTEMAAAASLTRALSEDVNAIPDGHSIIIDSNSPEQQAQLEALGLRVETLPDGTFRVTSNTGEGQAAIDAFVAANNGKPIDMFVQLQQKRIGYWESRGASPQDAAQIQGPVPVFANGKLPDEALIAPGSGGGLVQWAEGETGGEAFIPMGDTKRPRATTILGEVADRFGFNLVKMADGGIRSAAEVSQFPRANGLEGSEYDWGGVNWGDCSGAMAGIARYAVGMDPWGGRFATGNQGEALSSMGFQSGTGGPGTLSFGWMNGGPGGGHTAGTLPDGTNVEMGGGRGNGQVGGPAAGADDPQFTDHAYLPLQGDPGVVPMTGVDYGPGAAFAPGTATPRGGGGGGGGYGGTVSIANSGPIDVRVTNFADLADTGPQAKVTGNLKFFANGGIESQDPQIANTANGIRMWAEPQAGPWESYIPGDPSKRSRAIDIWRETGKKLNVTEYADGGIGFGGYANPKSRDYMKPTSLYEAAALATGLGFSAASGLSNYIGMAQSGTVDLSSLAPQFDTASNAIPGLSEAMIGKLDELVSLIREGGMVTADVNVDTSNGAVTLDLMKTGLA